MTMPELSLGQFDLVYTMLSLAIASMLASFAFFVMARQQLAPKYRPAMIMSALVVGIVTTPFHVERRQRMARALEGLESLRRCADAVLVLASPDKAPHSVE